MSKNCDICHQPYDDHLSACPHCGPQAENRPATDAHPDSSVEILLGSDLHSQESDSSALLLGAATPKAGDSGSSMSSSMDFPLDAKGSSNSAMIVPGESSGSSSDIMEVDWSAVSEPSGSQLPIVDEPGAKPEKVELTVPTPPAPEAPAETSAPAAPVTAAADMEAKSESGSHSVMEINLPPEHAHEPSSSSDMLAQMATLDARAEDSSALNLGETAAVSDEELAAVSSSSHLPIRDVGEVEQEEPATITAPQIPADENELAETGRTAASSRGWIGVGAVGVLVGCAACVGIWALGMEPPQWLRLRKPTQPKIEVKQLVERPAAPQPAAALVANVTTPTTNVVDEGAVQLRQALSLAKDAHYNAALKALDDARTSYVSQAQGKSANPAANAFLPCCDELRQYWQVRSQLTKAGYLKAADRANTESAVAALLAKASASAKPQPVSGKPDTILRLIGSDPDVRRHDPRLEKPDEDLRLLLEAKRKALNELATMPKPTDHAPASDEKVAHLQKAQSQLREALTAKQKAIDGLASKFKQALQRAEDARKELILGASAAGVAPAPGALVAAIERLRQDRQSTSAQLEKAIGRLQSAGWLPAGSTSDQLLAGLDRALERQSPSMLTTTGSLISGQLVTVEPPQPDQADKHFSDGLNSYWSGDYTAARRAFAAAIRDNNTDARYYYFLGLTLLQQERRADALKAFRQGGQREKEGYVDSRVIGMALERIQGSTRSLLDQYRP